jgi:hypothetical protein
MGARPAPHLTEEKGAGLLVEIVVVEARVRHLAHPFPLVVQQEAVEFAFVARLRHGLEQRPRQVHQGLRIGDPAHVEHHHVARHVAQARPGIGVVADIGHPGRRQVVAQDRP